MFTQTTKTVVNKGIEGCNFFNYYGLFTLLKIGEETSQYKKLNKKICINRMAYR